MRETCPLNIVVGAVCSLRALVWSLRQRESLSTTRFVARTHTHTHHTCTHTRAHTHAHGLIVVVLLAQGHVFALHVLLRHQELLQDDSRLQVSRRARTPGHFPACFALSPLARRTFRPRHCVQRVWRWRGGGGGDVLRGRVLLLFLLLELQVKAARLMCVVVVFCVVIGFS